MGHSPKRRFLFCHRGLIGAKRTSQKPSGGPGTPEPRFWHRIGFPGRIESRIGAGDWTRGRISAFVNWGWSDRVLQENVECENGAMQVQVRVYGGQGLGEMEGRGESPTKSS
jgi:hypothetical protein